MKNVRTAKILWSKSGRGLDTTRLAIPVSWVREIGLSKEIRELEISFDTEAKTILLKKKDEPLE